MWSNWLKELEKTIQNGTITENDPKAETPIAFKKPLKEHQLKVLERMTQLEGRQEFKYGSNTYKTNFGVLCDKVGAGKSIMLLSTIVNNKVLTSDTLSKSLFTSHSTAINSYVKTEQTIQSHPSNVIVVPKYILVQWQRYIEDFTNLTQRKITTKTELEHFNDQPDVILVSNGMYNQFAYKFQDKYFSRVIFDEADTIKIPSCSIINAHFYWFVSASVLNLLYCRLNHTGFIKNVLLSFQQSECTYFYVKNNDAIVNMSLQLPEPIINIIKCKNNNILNIVGNAITNEAKLMISAGDISGAINELNIFGCENENIIEVISFNLVKKLENEKLRLETKKAMNYSSETEKNKSIENSENIIKEIEQKINLIQERINSTDLDPISYEEIKYPVITKCCQNKFEFTTLIEYIDLQNKKKKPVECPMCRKIGLSQKNLVYIKDPNDTITPITTPITEEYKFETHDKYENLNYLLSKKINKNSKILIMSEFDRSFTGPLINLLNKNNLKYMYINTPNLQINTVVNKYKNNEFSVLLMNARNYGAGINLENTDDIIILHKMNVELEKQVIGRAQRLGRTSTLHVWKLYHLNE